MKKKRLPLNFASASVREWTVRAGIFQVADHGDGFRFSSLVPVSEW